ncbi:MAG: ribonuclease D [Alphaproteobacteria bacterium]|nr:ribonuclease D [Alphaproteobacteria bacterium]
MTVISDSATLASFCATLARGEFVTVDTEFIRDQSYWPQLCLVQIGGPDGVAAVDPLAEGMTLDPLLDLLADRALTKVFHSARQDIEIFYHLTGAVPTPVFDTQVAAMVCGFGDAASYETLAAKLAKARVDKSSRFTDWARRPLSDRQLRYALDDVIHLRPIYRKLADRLDRTGRASWVAEEMATLTNPETYALRPEDAWRRLKTRNQDRRFLAVLRELSAWREIEAQRRDVPRAHVLGDSALLEIAAHAPRSADDLARTRVLTRKLERGDAAQQILAAIAAGLAVPEELCPNAVDPRRLSPGAEAVVELLKVLLRLKCAEHHVAPKLVASVADLEAIAADAAPDLPALQGWRHEVFGSDALAIKQGRLAIALQDRQLVLVPLQGALPSERAGKGAAVQQ